jgi:hypothetical protein
LQAGGVVVTVGVAHVQAAFNTTGKYADGVNVADNAVEIESAEDTAKPSRKKTMATLINANRFSRCLELIMAY